MLYYWKSRVFFKHTHIGLVYCVYNLHIKIKYMIRSGSIVTLRIHRLMNGSTTSEGQLKLCWNVPRLCRSIMWGNYYYILSQIGDSCKNIWSKNLLFGRSYQHNCLIILVELIKSNQNTIARNETNVTRMFLCILTFILRVKSK